MPTKSTRLRVVGADNDTTVSLSNEFQDALDRWTFLEGRLSGLLQKQDALISETPNKAKIAELQSVIEQVEYEQSELLAEIGRKPCGNLHDVVVKLQIWTDINVPSDNEWSNPTDRLVSSALADLLEHLVDR